jgi:hypothetical protein
MDAVTIPDLTPVIRSAEPSRAKAARRAGKFNDVARRSHPVKNTRRAIPRTAKSFFTSVLLLILSSPNTRSQIVSGTPTVEASGTFDQWMKAGAWLE